MKRIVFIFTTFLMLGVNLAAEVQGTNEFPVEESGNLKNNIGKEIQEANAMEEKSELVKLAQKHFGELSEAEVKFFTATAKGELEDYRRGNEKDNNPENADKWGDERILRASVIEWLCTDRKASRLITHKGIYVGGVRVDGELNLEFAKMDFPFRFLKSVFKDNIILQHSKLKYLDLGGTYTKAIIADCLEVEGSVYLRDGFKAEGEVRLLGAKIGGNLSCINGKFINPKAYALSMDGLKVEGGVFLRDGFKAEGEVRLVGADIGIILDCVNGKFINPKKKALNAAGLKVKGDVLLSNGFKADGEVRLSGADIGGDLYCVNSKFINPKAYALIADRLKVKGCVFLSKGFKAEGEVRLPGAEIGGTLDCSKSEFINPKATALNADELKVKESVFLSDGFKAEGGVRLLGAEIEGMLSCINSMFINPNECALLADRLKVKGGVFLRDGFKAEGKVSLSGAEIGGNLDCDKSEFINPNECALHADGLKVKGSVFLRNGFKAEGGVRLLGAEIGGNLECDKSEFINPKAYALSADGLKVKGSVFLRDGFKAEGEVRLLGAEIGGYLDCVNGKFINPKAYALSADGLKVEGNVFLRNGFKAEGEVGLLRAEIGGNLDCGKSEFINPKATALNADGLKVIGDVFLRDGFKAEGRINLVGAIIEGHFVYTGVKSPEEAELDLRSAKIGVLFDEEESWPKEGNLYLHGTVYEEIFQKSPRDVKRRIKWLRLNGGEGFSPQPYEQLAGVLKRSGHEKDATEVLITKNKDFAELGAELSKTQWLWYKVFGPMISYGYRPLKVFLPILIIIVLGWVLFWSGHQRGVMSPMAEDYPVFQSLVYSIDMFLPVVNLYQGNYWLPDASKVWFECKSVKISGWWLLGYLRIHIMAGWVLTTLLLGGLTGLIRT